MGVNPENILDLTYVNRDGDTMRGPLLLPGEPQVDAEATAKSYVDRLVANMANLALLRDGSLPMTGPLILSGNPTLANHAVRRAYADAQDALRLLLTGGVMTGPLTLSGAPTVPLHAANAGYVDAADALLAAAIALRVPLDGSVAMTGALVLPGLPTLPLHAATKGYVDALPTGVPTYDASVAAAGADYTSVVTACATEAAGARIFVKAGTYNETANIVMKSGQQLIGENPFDTIIDFGDANRKITPSGAGTNRAVENLTVQGSRANYTIEMNGDYDRVKNCRVIGTANANTAIVVSGVYSIVKDCYITLFSKLATYAIYLAGNYCQAISNTINNCQRGIFMGTFCTVIGNHMLTITNAQIWTGLYGTIVGNELYGISPVEIRASNLRFVGNFIRGDLNWSSDHDFISISGNGWYLSEIRCAQTNTHSVAISGNYFTGGDGIEFQGHNSSITGNTFEGSAHLQFNAGSRWNTAIGNNFTLSTEAQLTRINDQGLRGNMAMQNAGVPATSEKKFEEMKNTSGGALGDGDVVVLKAVAAGNEFTTTVNQGDDLVFGVVNEAIGNNAEGLVQKLGKITTLKCNGVINIAVGDLLGTFTAAGISMQAQAGDMAFAIALEAYAGADSLGVIDAILITPRKV